MERWKKLVSYIKNDLWYHVYVNRRRHLHECLVHVWEKDHLKLFWYFLFSLTLFLWKHSFNQEHNLLLLCSMWTVYLLILYAMLFSLLVLNVFCYVIAKYCLFSTASFSLVVDNSLVHDEISAAVELHLDATYTQHLALK